MKTKTETGFWRSAAIGVLVGIRRHRQERMMAWCRGVFGAMGTGVHERALRFLEEAVELVQALGMTETQAMRVLRYVYSRSPGEPEQELGGVAVTLNTLADACGLLLGECEENEFRRVQTMPKDVLIKSQRRKANNGIGAEPS